MAEVDHRLNGCPKIPGLLIPDLDDPFVGREKLALLGRRRHVDEVLDRKPHSLVFLHERARVSQVEYADLTGARSQGKRQAIMAVVQRGDFAAVTSKNSHPPFAPRVVEFDGADRCAECAETVRLLRDRRHIDRAHMYAPLQAVPRCVFANVNLPGTEELAPFQIQPEDLTEPRPIRTQSDRGDEHFGILAQICQISAEPRKPDFVVASHRCVKF
jgi:hypothetical protein